MNIKNKTLRRIFCLLLSFILCFQVFIPLFGFNVSAEETAKNSISSSDPLDDLMESTIDGKDFKLSSYGYNLFGIANVITFAEIGYSTDVDRLNEFELYVYVHNPCKLNIDKYSTLNCISLRFGGDAGDSFSKFGLEFVSSSTETLYEDLFYKFKVSLGNTSKRSIWESLSSAKRVYEIGEIELSISGNASADSYDVGKIFSYSGYAKGYGNNASAESTLKCVSGNSKSLTLDVHSTYYRPEGTQSGSVTTQDTLSTVYFSVPNEYIEKYGEMTAVHARWLDAVLKPALVSGNLNAHNAILQYTGKSVGENAPALNYAYVGNHSVKAFPNGCASHTGGFVYNHPFKSYVNSSFAYEYTYNKRIDALYMIFNAYTGEDNSADTYSIPSNVILSKLKSGYDTFGGELINGEYSSLFFESVADKFTDINIQSTTEYALTSSVISQDFWQKLLGLNTVTTTEYDGIKAIYAVSDTDFTGNDIADAKSLYINSGDFSKFKAFYDSNAKDSTVYLFRYKIYDYRAEEATLFEHDEEYYSDCDGTSCTGMHWDQVDTNAYFFQTGMSLDFDIIDITLTDGKGYSTVIPTVMSPVDIVDDATPPANTTDDNHQSWDELWENMRKFVSVVLVLVLVAVCLPILTPVLSVLVELLVKIITFPFKLISRLFSGK